MKADLHVHSTASDGTLTPEELVSLALESGLTHLALTDHDSVTGVAGATAAARHSGLTVIPAVELSTQTPSGDDVHIIGLFVDESEPVLVSALERLRTARLERGREIVRRLADAGYDISFDSVLELSNGGALGRSHVARALVASGNAPDIATVFTRLLGRDAPFYVPKSTWSPQDGIDLIHRAGGLAFVAHPGVLDLVELIRGLAATGLDGVEAFHPDHTHEQCALFVSLASELGLLVSGGTDFHSHSAKNPPLGTVGVGGEALQALLAAGGRT